MKLIYVWFLLLIPIILATNIPKLGQEIEINGQISQTYYCGAYNKTIIFHTNSKKMYRTNIFNHFTDITDNIHKIHQSPLDNNILIITYSNKTSWLSKNCGETQDLIEFDHEIAIIEFSPRSKMEMLILSKKQCDGINCEGIYELYHTKDLLDSQKFLSSDVIKANWGRLKSQKNKSKIPSSRIVLLRRINTLNQDDLLSRETYDEFVYSDDFLETVGGVEKGIVDYVIEENNVILIKNFVKNQQNNKLLICESPEIKYNFNEIDVKNFVNKLSQIQSFGTIENEVFIFVNHHLGPYTDLYSSKLNYYSSAKYVNVFNQNDIDFKKILTQNISHSIINTVNLLDESIKNRYFDVNEIEIENPIMQNDLNNYLETKISQDYGVSWSRLSPPSKNYFSQIYECKECKLNLLLNHPNIPTLYSVDSNKNFAISNGNVGKYLNVEKLNTYFTKDGGLNWTEIGVGPHTYEINEHGLILIAKFGVVSNLVSYSLDKGENWKRIRISQEKILIKNIQTAEYSSRYSSFIVFFEKMNEIFQKKLYAKIIIFQDQKEPRYEDSDFKQINFNPLIYILISVLVVVFYVIFFKNNRRDQNKQKKVDYSMINFEQENNENNENMFDEKEKDQLKLPKNILETNKVENI